MTKEKQYTDTHLRVAFTFGTLVGMFLSFLAIIGIGVVSAVAF